MNKKIAVIVSRRQDEALRMSIGLTLADDEVDVFFIDEMRTKSTDFQQNINISKELGITLYSVCEENEVLDGISSSVLSNLLLDYDHILPY